MTGFGRFLALHLSELPTDLIRRAEPVLRAARPLATWAASGNRRSLVAVDQAATSAGLRPGQALADAQAILPGLVLRPADPAADARALHALALWARRYTPLAALDLPDGLILDVAGCAHLLGGELALLEDALVRLRRAGVAARGAVAGAAATAGALARARGDNPVAVSGIEAAVAAPLPLGLALRLEPSMRDDLARLGLRRVGDLLDQPRGPLARRFGRDLLDRLDAVTGRTQHPLRPVVPPPDLFVTQDCPEPIITRASIEAALDRLLDALCGRLRAAGLGARRITFSAWRVDGGVQEVAIGTGLPSREPGSLRRLFAEGLGTLAPGLGFERMALEARAMEPVKVGVQAGLGGPAFHDEGREAEMLGQLLDGLAQRLTVHRVAPFASHWPERMVRALDPGGAAPPLPPSWARPAPVLLLRRPEALAGLAPRTAEGPPQVLQWQGEMHRVLRVEGPLRLEPEWWRSPAHTPRRDYHRVELFSGARLWLYRDGGPEAPCWRLHGHLP